MGEMLQLPDAARAVASFVQGPDYHEQRESRTEPRRKVTHFPSAYSSSGSFGKKLRLGMACHRNGHRLSSHHTPRSPDQRGSHHFFELQRADFFSVIGMAHKQWRVSVQLTYGRQQ